MSIFTDPYYRLLIFYDDAKWWVDSRYARLSGRFCEMHEAIYKDGECYWCNSELVSTRYIKTEPAYFVNGQAQVHAEEVCDPEFPCVIHRPSDHMLRDFPMLLRETALVERICPHGVGHPDPDSAAYMNRLYGHPVGTWETHGCCGGMCHLD